MSEPASLKGEVGTDLIAALGAFRALLAVDPVRVPITPPISTNQLFVNVPGRGRRKTAEYTAWRKTFGQNLMPMGRRPRIPGCVSIILRPLLSGLAVGGTDLGFWFAQQGSILTFIVLIFFYVFRMNAIDREYGVDE